MIIDPHASTATILASGNFEEFLGQAEDLHLEVKGATPYDLISPSGRYEFAKDVSAFANSEGGHLIFGLNSAKEPNARIDHIASLDLTQAGRLIDALVVLPEAFTPVHGWLPVAGERSRC